MVEAQVFPVDGCGSFSILFDFFSFFFARPITISPASRLYVDLCVCMCAFRLMTFIAQSSTKEK